MRNPRALWLLVVFAAVTVVLTLLASGCSQQQSPDSTVRPRIGALLALTGSGANYGKSLQQGIEMAKDQINAEGGVNGHPLEIVYEDSQSDAKTGVSAFNKLATVDRVPLVIGSISSVILAIAPIADQREVVLINSSAISPKICAGATNFLFSLMVSGAQEAQFMAGEFTREHKAQRIAVLYSNNSSGIDTRDAFAADLQAKGGQLAASEGYELNATDFRTQLAKIKASGAQAAYLIAFSSAEFARVLRQSRALGLNLQWYSYSGFETKETLDLAGDAAEGVVYSYPDFTSNTNAITAFQRTYSDRYHSWADIYTVTSYDAVRMVAGVVRISGLRSTNIRDALRKADFSGLFGPVHFGQPQCVEPRLTWKTVAHGTYQPLR